MTAAVVSRNPAADAFVSIDLSEYDETQSQLMHERCIIVDENDKAFGALDKKTCEFQFHQYQLFPTSKTSQIPTLRPPNGEYQQGSPPSGFLSIRFSPIRWPTSAATTCI